MVYNGKLCSDSCLVNLTLTYHSPLWNKMTKRSTKWASWSLRVPCCFQNHKAFFCRSLALCGLVDLKEEDSRARIVHGIWDLVMSWALCSTAPRAMSLSSPALKWALFEPLVVSHCSYSLPQPPSNTITTHRSQQMEENITIRPASSTPPPRGSHAL